MRINQYIALHISVSRREADKLIKSGLVVVNDQHAEPGYQVKDSDKVVVNNQTIEPKKTSLTTIMLNKPVGYVCSRDGQGSKTIFDLLDDQYKSLKPVGRLDKDSSGLILLSNDGQLTNELTHPSFNKIKRYQVELNKTLLQKDSNKIVNGVILDDGLSKLNLKGKDKNWVVEMNEGRNRQIRRTFGALGYSVMRLHRIDFGPYHLDDLKIGQFKEV